MATIIFENTNTIEASDKYKFTCMGTFYTRNSVLTSRTCAFCIHLNMRSFFVLKTPSDEAQPLHIDDVYFRRNVHTSNPFGILKVSNKILIGRKILKYFLMEMYPDTLRENDHVILLFSEVTQGYSLKPRTFTFL